MQVADLLLKIIIENESWVFACEPEMKILGIAPQHITLKEKSQVTKYQQQVMLITWVCFITNFSL
jgi:hypothetical protein